MQRRRIRPGADGLVARGRDPKHFGVHGLQFGSFFIDDDRERVRELIRPYIEWEAQAMDDWYEEAARSGHDAPLQRAFEERRLERLPGVDEMIVETAAESIAAIETKLEEAPYTHLVFGAGSTLPAGMPLDQMAPYLERFAQEVIPPFSRKAMRTVVSHRGGAHEGVSVVLRLGSIDLVDSDLAITGADRHDRLSIKRGHELGDQSVADLYWTRADRMVSVREQVGMADSDHVMSFRRIACLGHADAGPAAGVLMVLSDCGDPHEPGGFETWYIEHLEHVIDNADFFAAGLFKCDDEGRVAQYLAMYESESTDIVAAWKQLMRWWSEDGSASPDSMVFRARLPRDRNVTPRCRCRTRAAGLSPIVARWISCRRGT